MSESWQLSSMSTAYLLSQVTFTFLLDKSNVPTPGNADLRSTPALVHAPIPAGAFSVKHAACYPLDNVWGVQLARSHPLYLLHYIAAVKRAPWSFNLSKQCSWGVFLLFFSSRAIYNPQNQVSHSPWGHRAPTSPLIWYSDSLQSFLDLTAALEQGRCLVFHPLCPQ